MAWIAACALAGLSKLTKPVKTHEFISPTESQGNYEHQDKLDMRIWSQYLEMISTANQVAVRKKTAVEKKVRGINKDFSVACLPPEGV